jgi:hypothetical protein
LKSCCNNAPLPTADSAGITSLMLFMAIHYQLRQAARFTFGLSGPSGLGTHKKYAAGSKYRVPPAPVTEPSKSSARIG